MDCNTVFTAVMRWRLPAGSDDLGLKSDDSIAFRGANGGLALTPLSRQDVFAPKLFNKTDGTLGQGIMRIPALLVVPNTSIVLVFAETWAFPVPPALVTCGLFHRRSTDSARSFGPLKCVAGLDEPNTPGNVPNYVGNIVPLVDTGFGRDTAVSFVYTHANNVSLDMLWFYAVLCLSVRFGLRLTDESDLVTCSSQC